VEKMGLTLGCSPESLLGNTANCPFSSCV